MKNFNRIVFLMVISFNIISAPVGTQFSYQGQLLMNGSPANGVYDFKMELWNQMTGGTNLPPEIYEDIIVTNGLFTIELDFGDTPFVGDAKFLKIQVRDGASVAGFTQLSPRQRVNAVPYAIQSQFVENGSSPWLDAFSGGIEYNGDVSIGNTVFSTARLTVNSSPSQDPLKVFHDNSVTFAVKQNGGSVVGSTSLNAPENGLFVEGNVNQRLLSHGFVKAGVIIGCGPGTDGPSDRQFININGITTGFDFTTASSGAAGYCSITVPFSLSDAYWVVSANQASVFTSYNASCRLKSGSTTVLQCQISELTNAVTSGGSSLQILFY